MPRESSSLSVDCSVSAIRSLGVLLLVLLPGLAIAQPNTASPSDLDRRIEVAEQAWLEAVIAVPSLVSLGAAPEWGNTEIDLTSSLRARLKLLNRKVLSNRQWQQHWIDQRQAASGLEALYGQLVRTATAPSESQAATAKQNNARDWTALAVAKTSNQDVYLSSIETERDSVEERLESALGTVERSDAAKSTLPAPVLGATPFEERKVHIAALRFRQGLQSKRRALAVLELKLIEQQIESDAALKPALTRDVELVHEEYRIASQQLLIPDPDWSNQWSSIAKAAGAKAQKIELELKLSSVRQHSLAFALNLAQSQLSYRDRKQKELDEERRHTEAFSGWLKTLLTTARQQAPRMMGTLLLIFLAGRLALWILGLAARTLVKAVEDDDPDHVSASEQRANTIAAVFKGVGKLVVYLVGILLIFDVVGIDAGPVLGSVAIFGLALSFGSQNLVRDFVNGFFILVENQYSVGDWVKIGEHEGDVEQINIRSTRLRSVTGVLQIIPNGTITTVENMTRDWSTFRCHVGVSYDTDIDLVERVCTEVGAEMFADPKLRDELLEAPAFVGVTQLGDSAVVVRSAAKTRPGTQWGLEREMNRRLKKAFEQAGIEIPFPQQVVWHRNKRDP